MGVVVLGGGVAGLVVGEVGGDGGGLVAGFGEDVAEAAAGVDDRFAGLFGGGDAGAGDDLRRADGGDVGAFTTEVSRLVFFFFLPL